MRHALTTQISISTLKPGRSAIYKGETVHIKKWISDRSGTIILATRRDGTPIRDQPHTFTPR